MEKITSYTLPKKSSKFTDLIPPPPFVNDKIREEALYDRDPQSESLIKEMMDSKSQDKDMFMLGF